MAANLSETETPLSATDLAGTDCSPRMRPRQSWGSWSPPCERRRGIPRIRCGVVPRPSPGYDGGPGRRRWLVGPGHGKAVIEAERYGGRSMGLVVAATGVSKSTVTEVVRSPGSP